jgi:predicted nuclease with TOPRIM domain
LDEFGIAFEDPQSKDDKDLEAARQRFVELSQENSKLTEQLGLVNAESGEWKEGLEAIKENIIGLAGKLPVRQHLPTR